MRDHRTGSSSHPRERRPAEPGRDLHRAELVGQVEDVPASAAAEPVHVVTHHRPALRATRLRDVVHSSAGLLLLRVDPRGKNAPTRRRQTLISPRLFSVGFEDSRAYGGHDQSISDPEEKRGDAKGQDQQQKDVEDDHVPYRSLNRSHRAISTETPLSYLRVAEGDFVRLRGVRRPRQCVYPTVPESPAGGEPTGRCAGPRRAPACTAASSAATSAA